MWRPISKLVRHFLAANFRDVRTGKHVTEVTMNDVLLHDQEGIEAVLHVRTLVFVITGLLCGILATCLTVGFVLIWSYGWERETSYKDLDDHKTHGSLTRVEVSHSWKFFGFKRKPYDTDIKPKYVATCEQMGEEQFKRMYHGDVIKMRPKLGGKIRRAKRIMWLDEGPTIVLDVEYVNEKLRGLDIRLVPRID